MLIELSPTQGDNTAALRAALEQVASAGKGTLRLLPGVHHSGSLQLPGGLRLELCQGATLKALPSREAMHAVESPIYSRMDVVPWKAFLYAVQIRDLTICGEGTIDGSGDAECFQDGIENSPQRPYGFHCIDCENITIRDVTFKHAGFWMQRYLGCRQLHISGIHVFNHANKNNDGLDVDSCSDVVIENCHIDASDDALCIKSEGSAPARNIRVQNCTLSSHASAFKLGTGSVGGFEDITATHLKIVPSKATEMHHPLGFPGGIGAICFSTTDGGHMRRIRIEDVEIEGQQCPIFIRLGIRGSRSVAVQGYGDGEDALQGVAAGDNDTDESVGRIEDIHLSKIRGKDLGPYPIILCGVPGYTCANITLEDIDIQCSRPGSDADLPAPTDWRDHQYPMAPMFGSALPAYGLCTRAIKNLKTKNLTLRAADGEPRPETAHYKATP